MSVDFRCTEYAEGNLGAISIVTGFGGNRLSYEPAARALLERGYDVYTYDYDEAVLLDGDPNLLPGLIADLKTDFEARAVDNPIHRHMGHSLGCGIAWNLQKNTPPAAEIRPGLYAAGGTDVARLIMHNRIFQNIIRMVYRQKIDQAYYRNGYSEDDMRAVWADIQLPPTSGFVLAVGGLDPIIPPWQIRERERQWRREGVPVTVKTVRYLGHTSMKKWLVGHIPEMLGLSHKLEYDMR